jgi:hypothetical protein
MAAECGVPRCSNLLALKTSENSKMLLRGRIFITAALMPPLMLGKEEEEGQQEQWQLLPQG